MYLKRLTCVGDVKDVVFKVYERAFWVSNIDGVWVLMTRYFGNENADDVNVLSGKMLKIIGNGDYKGLDFVRIGSGEWVVCVSLDAVLFVYVFDSYLSDVVMEYQVDGGVYPHFCYSELLSIYGLVVYDIDNGFWKIAYTANFNNFWNFVNIGSLGSSVISSFNLINFNIDLMSFLNSIKFVNSGNIGYSGGFLV